ncbi:hypothetical protein GGS20DRAFT_44009 [Poronia punctata]|nr:hypothetical protein GGS20DRAFT_44009 [Poronia punctata]
MRMPACRRPSSSPAIESVSLSQGDMITEDDDGSRNAIKARVNSGLCCPCPPYWAPFLHIIPSSKANAEIGMVKTDRSMPKEVLGFLTSFKYEFHTATVFVALALATIKTPQACSMWLCYVHRHPRTRPRIPTTYQILVGTHRFHLNIFATDHHGHRCLIGEYHFRCSHLFVYRYLHGGVPSRTTGYYSFLRYATDALIY